MCSKCIISVWMNRSISNEHLQMIWGVLKDLYSVKGNIYSTLL